MLHIRLVLLIVSAGAGLLLFNYTSHADEPSPYLPSYIEPLPFIPRLTYLERIQIIQKYIDQNAGKDALDALQPFLNNSPNAQILILAAQSYAELNDPITSLDYFNRALQIADIKDEKDIANKGIAKMKKWISEMKPNQPSQESKNTASNPAQKNHPATKGGRPPRPHSAYEKSLDLARKYLDKDKGKEALAILKPLLAKKQTYEVLLLIAQSNAELNKPLTALSYYQRALAIAKTNDEIQVAQFGVGKMLFWNGRYYRADTTYKQLMSEPVNKVGYERALAGRVKSLAYADRPRSGYHLIPKHFIFTLPEMVVAAAQASLWSDWADITKDIVTHYQTILKKITPGTSLMNDLKDVLWQMNQATWANTIMPTFFFSGDSEDFQVKRTTVNYSHYWSQTFQTLVGVENTIYTQYGAKLTAKNIHFGQTIRPNRSLILKALIAPANFELWDPTLWTARANYQPSDYIAFIVNGLHEVVETFPAFYHHITDTVADGSLLINPIPYLKLNGSLSHTEFSDTNIRNGYYMSATATISSDLGLSLIGIKRGYTDKFVSPYYFSPNRYMLETIILNLGSKAGSTWHYYIDGGLGSQLITVYGTPTSPTPTYQWGCGINGPITNRILLSAYYAYTTQASSFINTPNYRYQYGAVSLNFLL